MYTDGGVSGFLAFLVACTVTDLPSDDILHSLVHCMSLCLCIEGHIEQNPSRWLDSC